MANLPKDSINVTVHITKTWNNLFLFFSSLARDESQLSFLSASTLPWMNEYKDQADLALLRNILSPRPATPQQTTTVKPLRDPLVNLTHRANEKDQPAGDLTLDEHVPDPPQAEVPTLQASSPDMPCTDIRSYTPEQKLESERASAEKAKIKHEQRLKQIAKAKEERKLIAAFETEMDSKKKENQPKLIRFRDPPQSYK